MICANSFKNFKIPVRCPEDLFKYFRNWFCEIFEIPITKETFKNSCCFIYGTWGIINIFGDTKVSIKSCQVTKTWQVPNTLKRII